MSEPKVIKQIRLSEKYKHNYCPFCRQELQSEGKDFRQILSPMRKFTTVEICKKADGSEFEYFDNYYTCDRETCRDKKYTEEDIVKKVTVRFDGTKWDEKSKPFLRWNSDKQEYEEAQVDYF